MKDGQDGAQERDMFIDRASFHSQSTNDLNMFFPPHRCRFTSNFPDSPVFVLFWMHTSFSWNWRTRSFQEHLSMPGADGFNCCQTRSFQRPGA